MNRVLRFRVIVGALIFLLFTACRITGDNNTSEDAAIRTVLRKYPVGAEIACLIVNNTTSDLKINWDVLVERKEEGGWDAIPSQPSNNLMDYFPIPGNGVFIYSLIANMNSYSNQEGHYRITAQNYDGKGTYQCELWVVDDWDSLHLEGKLQKSPFISVGSESDTIEITVDPEYTVLASEALGFDYTISNRSEQTFHFGEDFYIELLLNGEFYLTPIAGWDAVKHSLDSGETITLRAYLVGKWSPVYKVADPFVWSGGEYRLIKILKCGESAIPARYFVPFSIMS